MHVDWHVYKFLVSFTVWLQPFNNSVAAMNYNTPPAQDAFSLKGPIYAGRVIYKLSLLSDCFSQASMESQQKTKSCFLQKVTCIGQACARSWLTYTEYFLKLDKQCIFSPGILFFQ